MADTPRRSMEAAVRGYVSDETMQADLARAAQRRAGATSESPGPEVTGVITTTLRPRTAAEYAAAQARPPAPQAAPSSSVSTPNIHRPIGRLVLSPSTRGHSAARSLAAEVERHQVLFGRVLEPPHATVLTSPVGESKIEMPVSGSAMLRDGTWVDIDPRSVPQMRARAQWHAISTPAGLPDVRMGRNVTPPAGSVGEMAGMDPSAIRAVELGVEREGAMKNVVTGRSSANLGARESGSRLVDASSTSSKDLRAKGMKYDSATGNWYKDMEVQQPKGGE